MFLNNNFNVLPWYDSLDKQNSKNWYAYGQSWPLLCPQGFILPFQFVCEELEITSSIQAINIKTGEAKDLGVTPTVSLGTQPDATYYVVKLPSQAIPVLPIGTYYLKFNTSLGPLYSEEITFVDDTNKCVKIQYWNDNTLYFTSGEIDFSDDFKFELYIRSTIGKPEYEFEEELTKRLGYKFIESQTSNKIYKFSFVAPEYICDAMRLIRLCDFIKITTLFDSYNALSFAYEPRWEDQGDLAAVEVEFDTDCIIQKLESFNRRLKESFYNALLADVDEPVLFSTDTVAQYYTEFTSSVSLINGKLIKQLDPILPNAIVPNLTSLVIPVDNNATNEPAKKLFLSDLLNLITFDTANFVTITGIENITGEKNFTGGLKVNGSPITYNSEKGYWKLEGDLLITGGITQYASETAFKPSTIMSALVTDEENLKVIDGVLTFIGEVNGLDEEALQKYLDDYNYAKLTDVDSRINDLVNGAPQAYDTLKEIADVLQGNVNSIGDIITTLGTKADKTYVDTELAKYIPIAGDTEVTGIKNFLNGLKVGGLPISKYEGHDDVIYIDANVVLRGGLTQYAVDPVTIPSIIESLPQAGYESKGVASFSSEYFVIDANGKVSIIPDSVGLNEEELTAWLANSDYTTKTYVDDTFATKSSLNATNAEVAKKWTQDDDKIANWDTAYSWGNHASAGYFLATNFTKANIVAKLGISDWALAATKPSYTTKEVTEDTNLYFTNQRAIDALTDTLKAYVTLKGTQTIEGEKDFIGGLKVNGSPIVYDSEKGYWLLQGNLLITGGLTQYVDDGSVDLPNLYDGLPIDGTTIYWDGDILKAKVAEGGITSITKDMVVEALGFTPYDASNPNGYITSAALNGYLPKTGGTIDSGTNWTELYVKSTNANLGFISYGSDSYIQSNVLRMTGVGGISGYLLNFTFDIITVGTEGHSVYHSGMIPTIKTHLGLATVATSGSYNDLSNKPTIPTNTNQLTNGAGFITSSALSSYLPLSGGTLTGTLRVNSIETSDGNGLLSYQPSGWTGVNNTQWGIGTIANQGVIRSNNTSLLHYRNGSDVYTIWDSGNSNLSSVDWNASKLILNTTNTTDWNVAIRTSAIQLLRTGETAGNAPYAYSSGISIMTSYTGFQLASYGGSDNELYFRSVQDNGAWLPWKTVAFTDSNVASATKLQTSRKIWGQDFNGTGNVSGDFICQYLRIEKYNEINSYGDYANNVSATLHLQYRTNGNVTLCYGGGSVGIGTITPSYKLEVVGTGEILNVSNPSGGDSGIRFSRGSNTSWSIIDIGGNLVFKDNTANSVRATFSEYGNGGELIVAGGLSAGGSFVCDAIATGGDSIVAKLNINRVYATTDYIHMFVTGGTNNSRPLVLQNGYGNVGIGTISPAYKLEVNGNGRFNKLLTVGAAMSATNSARAQLFIVSADANPCDIYLGADNAGKWAITSRNDKATDIPSGFGIYNAMNSNYALVINKSNNVGIGTASPFSKLHVAGAATIGVEASTNPYSSINFRNTDTDLWQISARFNKGASANNDVMNFYYCNGSTWKVTMALYTTGNLLVAGGITQYSDIRKKTKLQDVELTLKQVANAPLIEHYYNSDDKKTTHVGSIAQYWADMNDWFCKLDSDGYYTMEIQNAALASAISVARELERYESKTDKKIRMLKKRINELEDEIEILKKGA